MITMRRSRLKISFDEHVLNVTGKTTLKFLYERRKAKVSAPNIAQELGVSVDTVRKYITRLEIPKKLEQDFLLDSEESKDYWRAMAQPVINAKNALWRKWNLD